MINIISRAYLSKTASGPKKVVDNLIKGLDQLGYPYVANARLDACPMVWIHDDKDALVKIRRVNPSAKVVVGPNLYILPRHVPVDVDFSAMVYLQPSRWARDFWIDFGFDRCPIEVWPTGIDCNEFMPKNLKKEHVLIYFKQRAQDELQFAIDVLNKKNIPFQTITYGAYQEDEYQNLLSRATYVLWIGRQESQGIALQEALSANVPMLVWDVDSLGHWVASKREMEVFNDTENAYANTTSAPYFDQRCGLIIKQREELAAAIDAMDGAYETFTPREYVLEQLNLKKKAVDFLHIYEKYFHIDINNSRNEKISKKGKWKNAKAYFILVQRVRQLVKKIVKKIK